ncbi:hypothetical protein BH10PSE16_BH10PSE16_39590 [soil metagenome]
MGFSFSDFVSGIVDSTVNTIGSVVDTIVENPVKSIAVAVAVVASGGTALAFAGPIAATVGARGLRCSGTVKAVKRPR